MAGFLPSRWSDGGGTDRVGRHQAEPGGGVPSKYDARVVEAAAAACHRRRALPTTHMSHREMIFAAKLSLIGGGVDLARRVRSTHRKLT